MTESAQVVLIAVAALLVGVLIPVLLSLRSLIKRAEDTLDKLEGDTRQVLGQTSAVLERAGRISDDLVEGSGKTTELFDAVEEFGHSVRNLSHVVRQATAVSASVGPALAAAVTAYRASKQQQAAGDGNGSEPYAPEPEPGYAPGEAPPPPHDAPAEDTSPAHEGSGGPVRHKAS